MAGKKLQFSTPDTQGSKNELLHLRQQIDAIDRDLVALLDKRASLVFKVGQAKRLNQTPIHDPARESEVLAKIKSVPHVHLSESELQALFKKIVEYYRNIESVHEIMSKSKLPSACRVGFFGFGLIGASVGLALRERYPDWKFLVFDPFISVDEFQSWNADLGKGAFDLINEEQLKDLDYVFLGAPVHINKQKGIRLASRNKCVLNLGSIQHSLAGVYGFHPLAGKEVSKYHSSQADLFYGKVICLTGVDNLSVEKREALNMLAYGLGANPWVVSNKDHNETLAYTSHLIQLLSMAFGLSLKGQNLEEKLEMIPATAKEFLRLSGSSSEMWTSILKENRVTVIKALNEFEQHLREIKGIVEGESSLESLFKKSFEVYNSLYLKRRAS